MSAHLIEKNPIVRHFRNIVFIILGILLAFIGVEGFLIPNHFIDGGVTGLSMLISVVINKPLPLVILVVNIPFVVLGFRLIKWQLALRGSLAILGLSVMLHFGSVDVVTDDKLLAAVFGGLFLGGGIGFTLRGGGVLDGTEIVAIIIKKQFHLTIGDVILIFNSVLFVFAALFLGLEVTMYSILTYFSASRTIDFLVYGLDEYVGVMITSDKQEDIQEEIINSLGRTSSLLHSTGGYSKIRKDILFCVVSKVELIKLKSIVQIIDPDAFVVMHKISYTEGGMVKPSVLH